MSDISNLSRLVQPKSDQLNADDLIKPIIVTVLRLAVAPSADQPIIVEIDGGYKPYKPCKSMARLIMHLWGEDGQNWIGKRLELYNDHTVKWAGVEVGGIRIAGMSDIAKSTELNVTVSRGKRQKCKIKKLTIPQYPQQDFDANFIAWSSAVSGGKLTVEQLISKIKQKGVLSEQQLDALNKINKVSQEANQPDI